MSQIPAGSESKGRPTTAAQAPKEPDGNPAALFSFILGILICVPLVTSLAAVVLGLIGLRKSHHPLAGGRSLAVGGLAMGVVGLGLWLAATGFFANRWISSAPQRELTARFIQELSVSNLDAAAADSEPTFGPKRIQKWNDRLSHLGALQGVQVRGIFYNGSGADAEWTLTGRAIYSRGVAPFSVTVVKHENGWKVRRMDVKGGTPA